MSQMSIDGVTPKDELFTPDLAPVYRKAAALIEECGWWDGHGDRGGRACLVMALDAADESGARDLWTPLKAILCIRRGTPLSTWNDRQLSGEPIVEALLATADVCEGRPNHHYDVHGNPRRGPSATNPPDVQAELDREDIAMWNRGEG